MAHQRESERSIIEAFSPPQSLGFNEGTFGIKNARKNILRHPFLEKII